MQNRCHERGVSPWTHGDPLVGETLYRAGPPGIYGDHGNASMSLFADTTGQLAAKASVQDVGTPEQNQPGVLEGSRVDSRSTAVSGTEQIGNDKTLGAGAVVTRDFCMAAELGEESPRQERRVVQSTPARAGPSQT